MLIDRIHPILLVEDEPDDASFVRRALRRSNIVNDVVVCPTARQAREYLSTADENTIPVLTVVDIYLPNGENGLEFLGWLRRQPPPVGELPAMVFSQSSEDEHKVEATALRSVIFLTKPVTDSSIATAVQALGFVVTSTAADGRPRRIIEPR